jgi:dTDP-4-amino-4,6-dideoxygalactose transaminase
VAESLNCLRCTIAIVPRLTLESVPMQDFSRQYGSLREEILQAITHVCDSQSLILGPVVGRFEKSAAAACSVSFAVGCASGTDALWLEIAGTGIGTSTGSGLHSKRSEAVLTSPFSFFASASAILRTGARPVFADIDPRTMNLSPDAVSAVLRGPAGKDVRALLPVHLYGQCADMDALCEIASSHELVLLEDAAQAIGATWRESSAGSFGQAAAFSFYPTKNLAAMGDAGLVTTSDARVAARIRALRNHGMAHRYLHDEVGWNARMDAIQAAVLEVKLRYLPVWNQQRRERAGRYDHLFRAAGLVSEASVAQGIVLPWTDPRAEHVFHQYVIRAPRREQLREHLTQLGIGSEVYYPVPLHLQRALRELGYKAGDFPVAEAAAAEVLALPIYPELREDEQQAVVEAIRSFYS